LTLLFNVLLRWVRTTDIAYQTCDKMISEWKAAPKNSASGKHIVAAVSEAVRMNPAKKVLDDIKLKISDLGSKSGSVGARALAAATRAQRRPVDPPDQKAHLPITEDLISFSSTDRKKYERRKKVEAMVQKHMKKLGILDK
jgi:hypothetical protein